MNTLTLINRSILIHSLEKQTFKRCQYSHELIQPQGKYRGQVLD